MKSRKSPFFGQRVLIAEDEWLIADQLRSDLVGCGADVVGTFPTVDEALGPVRGGEPIDAAVLDINLKGEQAYPIADALQMRGIPFIFASAYDFTSVPDRFRSVPRCRKPLLARELEELWGKSCMKPPAANQLLASLPLLDCEQILASFERVSMPARMMLECSKRRIEHCYFLESGVASLFATGPDGECLEVGMIGREGMSGLSVVLGLDRSSIRTVILIPGTALRVPAGMLSKLLSDYPSLKRRLDAYAQTTVQTIAQSALAAGRYTVTERLARWLLMLSDRLGTPTLGITHDQVALVLGVRRASVTLAFQQLADQQLIRTTRGEVEIREREALIMAAGGCYGPVDGYQRQPQDPRRSDLGATS